MKKAAVRTMVAIGCAGLGMFAYCEWLNIPPTVDIPATVLPSPNGYDALDAAANLEVKARDAMAAVSKWVGKSAHVYPIAEKEALIAANQPALAAARRALTLPFCVPPDPTGMLTFKTLSKSRQLSRLFVLDGQVRESHGDYAGAAQSGIDAVELGIAVPHGGALTPQIIGVDSEAAGERLVWREVDKLDAAGAAAAATRLDAVLAKRYPFAETIRREKEGYLATLVKYFRTKSAFQLYNDYMKAGLAGANAVEKVTGTSPADSDGAASVFPASEMLGLYKYVATHSKRQIVADYSSLMDAVAARAEKPFTNSGPEIPTPADLFSQMTLPIYDSARFRDVQLRAQGGLLTCALALRVYRLQHGEYSATLADLTISGILKSMPGDPFAKSVGTPFRYRRVSADKYVLYSVGPDGIDDGGKPVPPPNSPAAGLQATDKGDWVVSVDVGRVAEPPALK